MGVASDVKIEQVMQIDIVTAIASDSVYNVAKLMEEENVGSVLIVTEDYKLLGIITDRQIVLSVVSKGLSPNEIKAKDIMTKHPITIFPDTTCKEALDIMGDYGYRRLPVEKAGKLVGIVSLSDISPLIEFDDECITDIVNELSSDVRYK